MRLRFIATSLFVLAAAHSVVGSRLADPESATLVIAGASTFARHVATQLLGASIAAYAVAGFATLGIAAPTWWRAPAMIAGAASSLLLASLVWRTATGPLLALAGMMVLAAVAGRRVRTASRAL